MNKTIHASGLMLLNLGAIAAFMRLLTQPFPSPLNQPQLLPNTLNIQGWKMVNTMVIKTPKNNTAYDLALNNQVYYLQNQNTQLTVQLRYIFNTDGSIGTYQRLWESSASEHQTIKSQVNYLPQFGYYYLAKYQDKHVLNTCFNPDGENTVTAEQFLKNRLTYDVYPYRLFSWLTGQNTLFDKRCLWVNLNIQTYPVESNHFSHQLLAQFWRDLVPQLRAVFNQPLS